MKKKRLLALALAFTTLVGNGAAVSADTNTDNETIAHNLKAGTAYEGDIGKNEKVDLDTGELTYTDIRQLYQEKGYKSVSEDTEIRLAIEDAKGEQEFVYDTDKLEAEQELVVDGKTIKDVKGIKFYEASGKTEDCPYVEWTFDVEKEGLYEMYVNMKPKSSHGTQIQRKILIDDEIQFQELRNVYFFRRFKEKDKVTTNAIGNEVWPSHVEVEVWQQQPVVDNSGYYEDPLQFYFTKGQHKVRFEYVDQDITMGDVYLRGSTDYLTYEEYIAQYKDKKSASKSFKIQAENAVYKSESTIRRESDTDPMTERSNGKPNSATEQMLNIIGGSRWSKGNQSIIWQIEVPEDGLYTINARGKQSDNVGMPSYRQIEIDGMIPFEELKLYPFEYHSEGWSAYTVGNHDKKGKLEDAYQFYLTKGTHTITMTVKSGAMYEIENLTNKAIGKISEKYIEITKVTGTSPDLNYEYHLARDMEYLTEDFLDIANQLRECVDLLDVISYEKSDMATNYESIITVMNGFAMDPDTIVANLSELENAQTSLGDYLLNLGDMPLTFDYLEFLPTGDKFEVEVSSFWSRLWCSILNFFVSFMKEYDAVGSIASKDGKKVTLEVWIARGREWGEILKSLADEDFTKETDIAIKLNILPSGQLNAGNVSALMLSITSGKAPDIGLGVSYSDPVEFAFRDAVVDLTQFDDFEAYAKKNFTNDTMLVPYKYKKDNHEGVYGLPETMDFTCIMYRSDIFEALEIDVPTTWNELWEITLPELDKNNMSFSFPLDSMASSNSPSSLKAMTMYLIQNDGAYYRDTKEATGKENMTEACSGLYTNLDTDAGIKSFQQWTDMYVNYGLDAESSFFTRFRTGTLPIGVGSYASYMQVLTQAPELYGRWSIAPMIGDYNEKGELINNVSGISISSCQLMSQSDKQKESWEFLKWWMDEDTQVAYGQDIEATMGISARWNTANLAAFQQLPWDEEDIKVISNSINTAIEQPIVLGGYFTTRHLVNAWNRVYMNNQNPRDAIEEAIKDINKELRTKHEEYGFVYED